MFQNIHNAGKHFLEHSWDLPVHTQLYTPSHFRSETLNTLPATFNQDPQGKCPILLIHSLLTTAPLFHPNLASAQPIQAPTLPIQHPSPEDSPATAELFLASDSSQLLQQAQFISPVIPTEGNIFPFAAHLISVFSHPAYSVKIVPLPGHAVEWEVRAEGSFPKIHVLFSWQRLEKNGSHSLQPADRKNHTPQRYNRAA